MGFINIFRNGSVTFCKVTQHSVTLRYALYRLELAHAVGKCILRRGGATCPYKWLWGGLVLYSATQRRGWTHAEQVCVIASFMYVTGVQIWCLIAILRHKLGQPKWEKLTLQHWIGWLDFRGGRSTQSINSTFADSFDSTRLQRQTTDSIDWLDRFQGLASTRINLHPLTLIVVINHLYLLSPSTTIHGILPIQSMCFTVFFHNLQVFFGLPLAWHPPPHTPYISSPNHYLLFATHAHTIATCNRQQWAREGPGARKITSIALRRSTGGSSAAEGLRV